MIFIGTSGYNYPEWKGSFYPSNLTARLMLPYYAERFNSVEINYTFYRMPNSKLVTGWAAQVPDHFRFTLKAPRRITHDRRLRDSAELVRGFCEVAAELGPKLGALLFQLPPGFKQDLAALDAFLDQLPPRVCAAFEFRNESWLTEEVYSRLRARNIALCIADSEQRSTPVITTADYVYFRLRDEGYQEQDIAQWTEKAKEFQTRCKDVYVYFKHEDEGKGAAFGQLMMEKLANSRNSAD
jgi:uncharacterized protein YecE (DUF72 family)